MAVSKVPHNSGTRVYKNTFCVFTNNVHIYKTFYSIINYFGQYAWEKEVQKVITSLFIFKSM